LSERSEFADCLRDRRVQIVVVEVQVRHHRQLRDSGIDCSREAAVIKRQVDDVAVRITQFILLSSIGGVYGVLNKRRGQVVAEELREGTPLYTVKAHLPVAESFGFTSDLRAATSGQAFQQSFFDHWQVLASDPLDKSSKAYEIVMKARKRKGLKDVLPVVTDYEDHL